MVFTSVRARARFRGDVRPRLPIPLPRVVQIAAVTVPAEEHHSFSHAVVRERVVTSPRRARRGSRLRPSRPIPLPRVIESTVPSSPEKHDFAPRAVVRECRFVALHREAQGLRLPQDRRDRCVEKRRVGEPRDDRFRPLALPNEAVFGGREPRGRIRRFRRRARCLFDCCKCRRRRRRICLAAAEDCEKSA